ncbi:MAG: type II/IV secretion system protein [Symploca sp. SIO2E6]|nr:type II/IV secretion system protein [Symploca sp. SIO2E6]
MVSGKMASPWRQLINGQITLDEALQLLVDPEGIVTLDLLDLEVSRRFRRHFPHDYELPPVIPLLLWRNCYYLGSTTELSKGKIKQLRDRTDMDLKVISIADKSYRDWSYIQEIDLNRIDPTRLVELFKEKEELEDLSTFTEIYLLKNKNATEQLNFIIAGAMYNRASDIHLEPTQKGLRVRYRIDGMLRDIVKPSQGLNTNLITALKVMSNMDIAERRRPLDGRVKMNYAAGQDAELRLDMRVSTFPAVQGEKAVIRLLPQKNPFSNVYDLGFTETALKIYQGWLKQPQGIIIITGPTGSGKTSTLYTSLQSVIKEFLNVVTIEDPVEYVLPGITQGQVLEAAGMTFSAGLRAILRQDPDVIMVGEIRDEETADTAVRAALTGHLVFTTLHTNDAVSAIPRLKGLGLDPSLISDALLGIVAQRLVRKICPYCAKLYKPTAEDLRYLGLEEHQANPEKWRKGDGCSKCSKSGYLGREGIIELIDVDQAVGQLICEGTVAQIQHHLHSINFDSFRLAAIDKVTKGVTTVEEVRRVLPYSVMNLSS